MQNIYYLIGAAMSPNFGDEMIAALWINAIRKADPQAIVVCDVFNPSIGLVMKSRFQNDVIFVNFLWSCVWRTQRAEHLEGGNAIFDPDSLVFDPWCKTQLDCLYSIFNAGKLKYVHIHGGGYINRMWMQHALVLVFGALVARKSNVPLYLTGLGLLPLDQPLMERMAPALRHADIVDVRDEGSFSFVATATNSASYSGDDALLMHIDKSLIDNQIDLRPENTLAITLQSDIYDGHLPIHNAHVIMNTLISSGLSGVDIIQCTPTDHLMPNETVDILKQNGIYVKLTPVFDVLRHGLPVYHSGGVLTTRFHPHLLGAYYGARGCVLASSDYYIEKHRSVFATMLDTWPLIEQETLSSIMN